MPYYTPLYQGEGISAPAGTGAGTSALYSCIGIAFVNQARQVSGLYHYPANTLTYQSVKDAIRQMVREIEPDQIVITPAAGAERHMGSVDTDIANVMRYVSNLSPNARIERLPPQVSAHLVWSGGQPIFNQPPHVISDDYDSDTSLGEHDLRAQIAPQPRSLGNGVFYYGVDGENNSLGPASPGAGPAGGSSQASSSGRPRFRKGSRRKWIRDRCIIM